MSNWLLQLALVANRLALGLYFLLAGAGKIKGGVTVFYEQQFLALKPTWLPHAFAVVYGHSVPFIEVLLGAMLILGWLGRLTAGVTTLVLLSFTMALAQAGLFFAGPGPFHSNIVFITLAVLLLSTGPGRLSLDQLLHRAPPETADPRSTT